MLNRRGNPYIWSPQGSRYIYTYIWWLKLPLYFILTTVVIKYIYAPYFLGSYSEEILSYSTHFLVKSLIFKGIFSQIWQFFTPVVIKYRDVPFCLASYFEEILSSFSLNVLFRFLLTLAPQGGSKRPYIFLNRNNFFLKSVLRYRASDFDFFPVLQNNK